MRNNVRFLVPTLLKLSAILTLSLLGVKSAIAATSNANTQYTNPPLQVAETQPSMSDLVTPTDSSFAALQDIAERYGCFYPAYYDGGCQLRCRRDVTRSAFAEHINACIWLFNGLIATGRSNLIRQEDIDTLKRLEQEFATEMDTLR